MTQKIVLILVAFAIVVFLMMRNTTDELSPIQRSVAAELPNFGFDDVDVTSLSTEQLSEISQLLHSNKGAAQITGTIRAILDRGDES